jgi:hypothetical protein
VTIMTGLNLTRGAVLVALQFEDCKNACEGFPFSRNSCPDIQSEWIKVDGEFLGPRLQFVNERHKLRYGCRTW